MRTEKLKKKTPDIELNLSLTNTLERVLLAKYQVLELDQWFKEWIIIAMII